MIIVPVGISFFTLQGIGYLINIYKGWEKVENNFIQFYLFIVFYPKFLSGPIERSNRFLPQLKEVHHFNPTAVSEGLRLALFGFFKKIVIANQLGIIVTNAYNNITNYNSLFLLSVIIIQPLYLYFDFSGYTDIAIGIAKAYGLELSPNFNRPFFSKNMTMFWKRFHISLSSWFNDYLYRQISFRYRKWGDKASALGVFVTFTLFGIWHGAGWNFMILGVLQAIAINFEYFTKRQRAWFFSKIPDYLSLWTSRLITYLFYGFSLIFFFSPDISTSGSFIARLFSAEGVYRTGLHRWELIFVSSCILIVMVIELIKNDFNEQFHFAEKSIMKNRSFKLAIYYLMIILVLFFETSNNIFVYQQF